MKENNPFTLTFGEPPREYISRYEHQDAVVSTFSAAHPVSRTFLIEGVRGSGKTVLMTKISEELDSRGDWIILNLNATNDLLEDMAERLSGINRKVSDVLDGGFNISVAGFGVGLGASKEPQSNLSIIRNALAELQKKNKKLLITVDEVRHNENTKHFASEFQIMVREGYPLYLIMTGLYDQIYEIQNDPELTFLLRSFKISIEPLNKVQIRNQYSKIFDVGREVASMLAEMTGGYAFAFQSLGMLYYEYRDTMDIDSITEKYEEMLYGYVYRKIWESLSDKDREVVLAMPDHPVKTREMCDALSMDSSIFSKYRDRLIKKGVMVSTKFGQMTLALPRFRSVIQNYELDY